MSKNGLIRSSWMNEKHQGGSLPSLKLNRKADIPSVLFVIVIVAFFGIILFILTDLTSGIFDKFSNVLENTPSLNNTTPDTALDQVESYNNSMWDYVVLFIALGYGLFLMFLAFTVLTDTRFLLIYIIFVLFGLVIGAGLSNMWQTLADNSSFAGTLAKFPITDTLLGSYYVIYISVVVIISVILLFGKLGGGER